MNSKEKSPGYIQFDDSKNCIQVFAEYEKEKGYELALELEYGLDRGYAEKVLISASNSIEIDNLAEILQSDRFLIKYTN